MPVSLLVFVLLVGVPIAEIALFIQAGKLFGLWPTLAAVVATALVGTALLRHQGFQVLRSAQASISAGRPPMAEVFDGACILIGGALLLTPGFLTDAIGLALLMPPVRSLLRGFLARRLKEEGSVRVFVAGEPPPHHPSRHGPGRDGPIIDAEFEEVDEDADGKGERDGDDAAPRPSEPRSGNPWERRRD